MEFGINPLTVKTWVQRDRNQRRALESIRDSDSNGESKGGATQRMGSKSSNASRTEAPARDDYGTAAFLEKIRRQLHRTVDKIAKMKVTEGNVHRIATALAKIESAGRVPFGYGGDTAVGHVGLINVNVHNARHDCLPPAIDVEVTSTKAIADAPVASAVETEDGEEE